MPESRRGRTLLLPACLRHAVDAEHFQRRARSKETINKMAEETNSFIRWRYAHYFNYVTQKDKNLVVECNLCVGSKRLSTSANSTSNLLKHLQRQHSTVKLVAKEQPQHSQAADSDTPTRYKQPRLELHGQVTSKTEINRLVAAYVVEEMLPISTVESPSFRSILRKIQTADGQESTSDRKTFASYLEKCYSKMESELKSTFERLEYVSTTADIWTCHNKSFLGMTAHWINPNNFKREKAAIACRRIKGRHTYDVVASEIEHVHSAFGLTHKVTATVTDNGSNFVKAFRVYEAATAPSDSEEEGGEEEEDNVVFADVDDILSNGTSDGEYTLPPHLRCASHTLNLISNNDVNKWLSANAEAKSVFRSATAKCSALWTKCSRSTVASELVENICKRKLIIPVTTRWNSFHDALTCILTIPVPQLNHLCAQLDIRVLSEREHKFLSEYCSVMKPLSIALDILQGEDNCYYGCLLPTLEVLMSKVLALQPSLSRMTAGLPDVIVQVVYVARNAKDNMVSYYHFNRMNYGQPAPGDWNTFFQNFMKGKMVFGPWYDHVNGWWKKKQTYPKIHYMFYEDMIEDTGREIDKLCSFLGLSPSAEEKRMILGGTAFDNMKKNDMANYSNFPLMDFKICPFMRKGKVGDWKNHLTVAQNEEFDEDYKQKMKDPTLQFRTTI